MIDLIYRNGRIVGQSTLRHSSDNPEETTYIGDSDGHLFRLIFDPEPTAGLFNWMDLWLLGWQPWESEGFENELPSIHNDAYRVDWFFALDENPEIIYGHLLGAGGQITELSARTDWAIVKHQSYNSNETDELAVWEERREHGELPERFETE